MNEVVSALNSHADAILRVGFDLTFSQFLFLLSLRDGPKTLTEAANFQGVSVAAISKRIDWFEERGLIIGSVDPKRGRKESLKLTAKGKNLIEKSSTVLETKFRNIFKEIKSIDLDQLNKDLNLINEHLIRKPKESKK